MLFKKNVFKLTILSLILYPLSFINQILISNYFGTSQILDHFWLCLSLVLLLSMHIGPLKENLVNDFHKIRNDDIHKSNIFLSENLNFWIIITLIFSLIFWFYPVELLKLSYQNRELKFFSIEISIFKSLVIFTFVQCLNEILSSILISAGKVSFQNLNKLFTTTGSILFIYLFYNQLREYTLVYGLISGSILIFIFQIWALKEIKITFNIFAFPKVSKISLKNFSILFFPGTIGFLYVVYEKIVFNDISSGLISSFQYAKSLHDIPQNLIILVIASSLWPLYIDNINKNKGDHIYEMTKNKIFLILLLFSLSTILIYLSAQEIIYLFFFRGSFDDSSLQITYVCLKSVILCLIPIGINTILMRAVYSFGGIKTISLSLFLGNISSILVLYYASIIQSITLATYNLFINSIVASIFIALSFLKFTKKLYSFHFWKKLLIWLFKLVLGIIIVVSSYQFPKFEYIAKIDIFIILIKNYFLITLYLLSLWWLFGVIKLKHLIHLKNEIFSFKIKL